MLVNIDLGEGASLDHDLALLRSADLINVACGFHAGDEETMRALCAAAAEGDVGVGAHVSYRDRRGFGRTETGAAAGLIAEESLEQIEALVSVARDAGVVVGHVKPHGALYHRLATDREAAETFTDAVGAAFPGMTVVTLPAGALREAACAAGLPALREGFADRAYEPSGVLVSRAHPGAMLDPDDAAAQAAAIAAGRAFATSSGSPLTIEADTICVHGDGARAIETAEAVARALGRS